MRLKSIDWQQLSQWALLLLLAAAFLWKGGKSLEATWVLTGIAAVITLLWHWQREPATAPRTIWLVLMAFVAWTIASYAKSSTANYGLDEVLRTGALALVFLWTLRTVGQGRGREQFFRALIRTVGIATLLACAIGVLVYVLQPVDRMVGTFFDFRFHTDYWPNAWASALLLLWPVTWLWLFRGWRWSGPTAWSITDAVVRVALMGLVLGCFLLSYSRGAFIALVGQLVLWYLLTGWKRTVDWQKVILIASAVGLAGLMVFSSCNDLRSRLFDVQSVAAKATFTADEGVSSVSERRQFWGQAITMTARKPLLGWGPYSFRFVQPSMEQGVLATSDHPHNVFLKLAAERGVPAALLFAVLVVLIGFPALRRLRAAGEPALELLLFLGAAGVLAHSMVDYNLQFVGVALPFSMWLGILASENAQQGDAQLNTKLVRSGEVILSVALLLVALVEGGFLVSSSLGRHAEAAGDSEMALLWYGRSNQEWFSRDLLLSSATLSLQQEDTDATQRALERYQVLNEHDSRLWRLKGDLARQRGDDEGALAAYEQAYGIGRFNDIGIVNSLVATLVDVQGTSAVEERRGEIDELMNAYLAAIRANTHFIALSTNVESFVELAERMASLYPPDEPRYEVMAAGADFAAKREREQIRSRVPGFLW